MTRVAIDNYMQVVLGYGSCWAWWLGWVGVTKDGANAVSQWDDVSGAGRHLVQATGANQPLWVADGMTGRAVLRTDGSNDFMQILSALNQPCFFFSYHKPNTLTAGGGKDFAWDGGTTTAALLQTSDPLTLVNAGAALSNGTLASTTVFSRALWSVNGVSSVFRYLGAQLLAGDAGANNPGGFTLSAQTTGGRSIGADWPEFGIYSVVPSDAVIRRLETYADNRGAL